MKLIVARSLNRVIGSNGDIPWHSSEDLKQFKKLTTGHTVVMGRKTYESLGKALPNRRNIVVTSKSNYEAPGCEVITDLNEFLIANQDNDDVWIIGGAEIYKLAIPYVKQLHITIIDILIEDGDIFFTGIDFSKFNLVSYNSHFCDVRIKKTNKTEFTLVKRFILNRI